MARTPRRFFVVSAVCAAVAGAALFYALSGMHVPPAPPVDGPQAGPRTDGETPTAPTPPRKALPYGRVVALVVGINKYPNVSPRRDLVNAEPDATTIADVFRQTFGYEVVTLFGEKATRSAIVEALEVQGQTLGKDDALIVYFAGHGQVIDLPRSGEAGFLVPQDATLDVGNLTDFPLWERQAINMKHVVDQINRMPAKHVLVIADACCSGFLTSATRGGLSDPDIKNFLSTPARTVLAATTRYQVAHDGKFTPKLVGLLRQLDGPNSTPQVASVYDLFQPLRKEVAVASGGGMTPQMAQVSEGDGMFVFVPASVPQASVDVALRDVAVRRQRMLREHTKPDEVYKLTAAIDCRGAQDAEVQQRSWEERFERFQRNAVLGDPWAMAALHYCYSVGLGTEKNTRLASHWARQVARANWPAGLGQFLLGRCYEFGYGISADATDYKATAARLYKESAELGSPLGRYAYGKLLLGQSEVPDDVARRGIEHLEGAVAAGVVDAHVELAYQIGHRPKGDEKQGERIVPLLTTAADQGSAHALFLLYKLNAIALQKEEFLNSGPAKLEVKRREAKKHLLAAAEKGHPKALLYLGYHHLNRTGFSREDMRMQPRKPVNQWLKTVDVSERADRVRLGIEPDAAKGRECWLRAAEVGEPSAMINLSLMYKAGDGVAADGVKGKFWIDKAVAGGTPDAHFAKGLMYLTGEIFPTDEEAAFRHLKQAADNGHPLASSALGVMYLNERGMPKALHTSGTYTNVFGESFYRYWPEALHYFAKTFMSTDDRPIHNLEPFLLAHEYLDDVAILMEIRKGRDGEQPKRSLLDVKDRRLTDQIVDDAKARKPSSVDGSLSGVLLRWERDNPTTYKYFEKKYLQGKMP